jgi:hypothetical protein
VILPEARLRHEALIPEHLLLVHHAQGRETLSARVDDPLHLPIPQRIRSEDGSYGTVSSTRVIDDANQRMYNLTVEEAHTFFVGEGQWLVHNLNCDLPQHMPARLRETADWAARTLNALRPAEFGGKAPESITLLWDSTDDTWYWGLSGRADRVSWNDIFQELVEEGLGPNRVANRGEEVSRLICGEASCINQFIQQGTNPWQKLASKNQSLHMFTFSRKGLPMTPCMNCGQLVQGVEDGIVPLFTGIKVWSIPNP